MKNKTNHTPGPWTLHKEVTKGEFVTDYIIRNSDNYHICKLGPNRQDANAALISAASDLFEALEKWALFMKENYTADDISWYQETLDAIAKAKGGDK